jgi:drug/metabolite transporter (DMT)-like permease
VGLVPPWRARSGGVRPISWAVLAWIIVLPTVAAYWLNVYALKRVESSVVSVFVYLQPVITALMAIPRCTSTPRRGCSPPRC